ncbi:sensor histidine kinase [Actinomadura rudentiformis]|uniref:histidine kinase n=1 Tax=Actinomadura rudentiformis TaxID=359158 RepID=A0A6H9YSJ1_9ACTN|nr:HAMP domain-containing sensor histidine kinase [Actinomadura rudentiformis]KAB2344019.1 HAMP domain-containing histidine kinase [Actinomadura rudentiformis]
MNALWRWIRREPEIRVRVTVSAVLVSGLLSSALYAAVMALVRQEEVSDRERILARTGRRVAALVRLGRPTESTITGNVDLVQVVDARRRVLAATPGMKGRPAVDFPAPAWDDDRRDGVTCRARGDGCYLVVAIRVDDGPAPRVVYSLARRPGLMPEPVLGTVLALCVPLIAGLIGYGTWRSAGRTLRPVNEIRRELDEITASDLERRVPVPPRVDEISRLARSVNATLDRLEGAVAKQRAFVSDLSHELRSPLTGLRTELELALSDPDGTDVPETLRAILKNTERLQAVVDDLQALARLDSQEGLRREPVDLHELADQEILRRPRRTHVTIEGDETVIVQGGRNELARLFTNLIDNADRHASTTLAVTVRNMPDWAQVEVIDDGPGIAPGDRERVFERFTRLAEGVHRDAGGTGLGLAIARDIATAHGGSLTITDREDDVEGARFLLRLPKS